MKKIFLLAFLFFASCFILPQQNSALDSGAEEMKLYMEEVKVIPVSTPTRVMIGNPAVADVVRVSEEGITLAPKGPGSTSLVFWDSFGEHSYRIIVLAEDINAIKARVDNVIKELDLPKVYTKAVETEGRVLILGEVKTTQDRDRLDLALGPLKEKTTNLLAVKEEALVDIDVQVLELNEDATKELGIQWPNSLQLATDADANGELWYVDVSESSPEATRWSNIWKITQWSRTNFAWKINFLAHEGKARILSQPRLTCLSGKEAELLVGGEKPIFTTSTVVGGGKSTSVEYKEYGIKLKIKPTVSPGNKISLALNIEVSELQSVEYLGSAEAFTASAYPLTKRNISTEIYLDDGQTLAIGGLIKQKQEEDVQKFPFLSDIPILGALFRTRTTNIGGGAGERGNTELFVTLTPTIVAGKESAPEKDATVSPPAKTSLPAETKPLAAGENIPPELSDYIKAVQLKILNAVYYPKEAKELGWEGTVNLLLRLASDGTLKDARVLQSSGYKLLDEAALDVVQKEAPYPAFPNQAKLKELRVQVPIAYRKN
jgi:pilus assembly protein CpaC